MTETNWVELVVASVRNGVLPVLRRAVEYLPGRLRLESARELAVPRVTLLGSLLVCLQDEAGELLF
jgi:hypothetical protein